jgi:hypothetical protein
MSGQVQPKMVGPLSRRGYYIFIAILFTIGAVATTGLLLAHRDSTTDETTNTGGSAAVSLPSKEYHDFAAKYLKSWPSDRMPEMILLFSGQQHNYEAPCGCTEPQSGGLERRYNLFSMIRGFGIPTVAMDLGDIYYTGGENHHTGGENHQIITQRDQAKLKYELSMRALGVMQYDVVNLGPEEFRVPLIEAAGFLLNVNNKTYSVLGANLTNKDEVYPGLNGGSVFEDFRVVEPKGSKIKVGVTGTLGQSAVDEIVKNNPSLDQSLPAPEVRFGGNAIVIPKVLAAMKPKDPSIRVLLYEGTLKEAEKLAQVIDDFDIIQYRSDESEPPSRSQRASAVAGKSQPKAQLVSVGHKGRWIGVMGVFRNPDNSLDMRWEVVLLNPDFRSPTQGRDDHPIVKLLEGYTKKLKDGDFLAKYVHGAYPGEYEVNGKRATRKFLGSEACKNCHAKEYQIWDATRHAGAYQTLFENKKAYPPHNRQYDGECVVCHTTGFKYSTGFRDSAIGLVDEKKSEYLFGVGCENCHGPGSLHAQNPKDQALLLAMSPWKQKLTDHLTRRAVETDSALDDDEKKKAVPGNERKVATRVFTMCTKCHDTDNDHDYKLEKWFKIAHGPTAKKN